MTAAATRGEEPGVPWVARTLNGWMGSNSGPRSVPRVHRWLYRHSGGRLGHGIIGLPALLLHTTGRRTGLRRTAALVYARDGDSFVVAASNYGGAHDPAWVGNIRANPRVEVQVARRHLAAEARAVERGEAGYDGLFALMNGISRNRYDHYQAGTQRPIPLVVIRPVEGG
ncbi:MAG: nitroreductase/quinone reductase family protein [Candidatus Dormibacteria bacterium]